MPTYRYPIGAQVWLAAFGRHGPTVEEVTVREHTRETVATSSHGPCYRVSGWSMVWNESELRRTRAEAETRARLRWRSYCAMQRQWKRLKEAQ